MPSRTHTETNGPLDQELAGAPASFKFFLPRPPLDHFVEYLYFSEVSQHFTSRVEAMRLPEVEAQLVFAIEAGDAFPGGQALAEGLRACLFLQPAHLQFIAIPGSIREAVGAALKPAGLRLVLSQGAGNLIDDPLIALEHLWGAEARSLLDGMLAEATPRARLTMLEHHLYARIRSLSVPSPLVRRAFELTQAAHGEISTERLAEACGCTSRTLRSLTVTEAGIAPKHLARIFRIRHALELLADAGVALTDTALTSAFSDHAHMSREFRELLGEPPSRVRGRIRSTALPSFSAERNLMSTGLLIMPKKP